MVLGHGHSDCELLRTWGNVQRDALEWAPVTVHCLQTEQPAVSRSPDVPVPILIDSIDEAPRHLVPDRVSLEQHFITLRASRVPIRCPASLRAAASRFGTESDDATSLRRYPVSPVATLYQVVHCSDGESIAHVVGGKAHPVEPAETVVGTEPQVAAGIPNDAADMVVSQTVGHVIGLDGKLLGGGGRREYPQRSEQRRRVARKSSPVPVGSHAGMLLNAVDKDEPVYTEASSAMSGRKAHEHALPDVAT